LYSPLRLETSTRKDRGISDKDRLETYFFLGILPSSPLTAFSADLAAVLGGMILVKSMLDLKSGSIYVVVLEISENGSIRTEVDRDISTRWQVDQEDESADALLCVCRSKG